MQLARYPGVRPFETFQKDFFFGREQDISDLYDLVMLEKMVVLFGRSGYGKSSLINAGLVPQLQSKQTNPEKRYIPLIVRPGSYVEGHTLLPLHERIVLELKVNLPEPKINFLDPLCAEKHLWYYFKQRHAEDSTRFILIFDQFEEFFTHPLDVQKQFNTELAELLYETIPQDVRRAARDLEEEKYAQLAQPMDIKALFAIRGDRLSLLDRMKTQLPAIFNRRFDLKALNTAQAKEAIVRPAGLKELKRDAEIVELSSPPFQYNNHALELILGHLASESPGQELRVEAFQLQIICTWVEDQVRSQLIPGRNELAQPLIMPEDLPDFTSIFQTYYKQQIEKLPSAVQEMAQAMIEEELLFVNPQTGEGRRLSVDKDLLIFKYHNKGLNEALLKDLEDTFLLRREPNAQGGLSFEISHDALIDPIAKARAERLEAIERQLAVERAEKERLEAEIRARAAEQERLDAEKRAQDAEEKARIEAELRANAERLQEEAQQQRNLAETRRASTRRFAIAAIVFAFVAVVLSLWGWRNATIATEALNKVNQANADRDLMQFNELVKLGDELFEGEYYQSALENYQQAKALGQKNLEDSRFIDLSQKIKACQALLQNK